MIFGLNEHTLKQIEEVFISFPEIEEVVLYGSRAKGTYKPASDIDLSFKGEKLNIHILNRIDRKLDNLLLPYTFDLSIHHHISQQDLLEHISRVGKSFYKSNCAV